MRSTWRASGVIAVAALCASASPVVSAADPPPASFRARLTPVPVEPATAASITGTGTVTATVEGTRLSVTGTFTGMKSPATIAQIHFGARGVRGPVEFDLTVEKASSGTVSGRLALNKSQLDSLRKGWFYVQIHAENAPDGNLWGWLLPV